jgi:hypothetical protein
VSPGFRHGESGISARRVGHLDTPSRASRHGGALVLTVIASSATFPVIQARLRRSRRDHRGGAPSAAFGRRATLSGWVGGHDRVESVVMVVSGALLCGWRQSSCAGWPARPPHRRCRARTRARTPVRPRQRGCRTLERRATATSGVVIAGSAQKAARYDRACTQPVINPHGRRPAPSLFDLRQAVSKWPTRRAEMPDSPC